MTADAVGGVWTYALALAEALRPHGITVQLATMGPRPSAAQRLEAARRVAGLHESDFRLEWMDDPWDDVAAAGVWLQDLVKRNGCDVVHLNGFAHATVPFAVPTLVAAHSCVLSWWSAVRNESAPPAWDHYRRAVRRGLDAASIVITPTRALLEMMQAEHGLIPHSRVIHNGLDVPLSPRAGKEKLVLASGRFRDEGKNLALLERIAPLVPWPLAVAGCDVAGESGLKSLGALARDKLRNWQGRAAIAVHPARYEPFGLVPLEAAVARCALVLADIPSLRELWDGAALFAHPDDAGGFAAAVNSLIADPALCRAMAARAARRARAFTASGMAAGYANAYRELLSRQTRTQELACAS